MHEPEGILIEEDRITDLKLRKELEKKGYKIIKRRQNENIIKMFEEDKTYLTCDKDEIIFRIILLTSTLARIIITETVTTVIVYSGKRVNTFTFKIARKTSLKGLRETYVNANSSSEFLTKYLSWLKENNDEAVLTWLKEFIKNKSHESL